MELYRLLLTTFSNIIMSYGLIYAYSILSNKKIKIKSFKINIIVIFFSILYSLNNYYNLITLKMITAFLIVLTMEKVLFKEEIKKAFSLTIIITLISIFIELITLPFIPKSLNTLALLNDETIFKVIYSIFNTLIFIIIISIKKIINKITKIVYIIKDFMNFYTIGILLIFLLNIVIYFFAYDIKNIQLILAIMVTALILLNFMKIIIVDKYNNMILMEKNKELTEEYKAYSKTIDECREFKHNLKNELYIIKARLPIEEQNLINNLIIKYNKNYEWINTLNDIPEGLQGLLYLKINEAKTKKIKIILNIKPNLRTAEKDYLDLSTILGILIDNAIEASEVAKSKNILINITEEKNITNIKILNKYKNQINATKIGKKNYSTKEFKSGLGLNYINKINKANIKVTFKIVNDLFITNLIYKDRNKINNK